MGDARAHPKEHSWTEGAHRWFALPSGPDSEALTPGPRDGIGTGLRGSPSAQGKGALRALRWRVQAAVALCPDPFKEACDRKGVEGRGFRGPTGPVSDPDARLLGTTAHRPGRQRMAFCINGWLLWQLWGSGLALDMTQEMEGRQPV